MKLEKVIDRSGLTFRRRYQDACASAHALDLVGERWALLVMRELLTGAKRFSDLRAGLPGISANVLTQRLEGLELIGLVQRRILPWPAAAKVYELTSWGYESEPIFRAMARWAARSPFHDPSLSFSTAALVLSLRTMFDPGCAGDLAARIGFRFGAETFLAEVADGRFAIAAGPIDMTDAILSGTPETVGAAIHGGVTLATLEASGKLAVEGDHALAERFVGCFPLPSRWPFPEGLTGAADRE